MATKTRVTAATAIGAALSFWLAGVAGAQNLVVNGDFATDASGWSTTYHGPVIAIAWSPLDPADPTPSGSLEVTSTISNGGTGGPTQCVDLLVAEPELRMDVLVPTQPAFAYVNARPLRPLVFRSGLQRRRDLDGVRARNRLGWAGLDAARGATHPAGFGAGGPGRSGHREAARQRAGRRVLRQRVPA